MDKAKLFVALDENNVVENYSTINYSHHLMEYCDCDNLHTKNNPIIGSTFDKTLNTFVPPKQSWMNDTWSFNTETLTWIPDPNVIYYHIEGVPHKWNPETQEWYIFESENTYSENPS